MISQENLLIDGKLVPAASGKVFETINPATEEVLGTAADAAAEDLDAAIGAARRAFDSGTWSTDPALRARGIPVRTAECRLATFCLDQGFALLHSSPGYEPFEKYLGLTVARP